MKKTKRKGFTLIEILVVLAITAMLSSIAIVYSHVGQNQISLSIEASKIGELILQAKELSIATYSQNQDTCGYGIHFDYATQEYSLFEYNLASSSPSDFCPSVQSTTANGGMAAHGAPQEDQYAPDSWQVHVAQGVVLVDATNTASYTIQDVLFYPPDPFTFINFSGASTFNRNEPGNVYLKTSDGGASHTIIVNSDGQVTL